MNARPARLPRALAASALALVLPLAACAGTDADADPAASGSSASGSSTSSAPGTSTAAPEGTGDATPAPAGRRIEVQVAGGQVSGDIGRVPVAVGEEITLVLTSDVADEAHVHGYDLSADLQPGTPAELTFPATIPGVFEVELHEAGTVLLTLQVS